MRGYFRMSGLAVLCALALTGAARADVILDNFDDGDLDGWTINTMVGGSIVAEAAPAGFGSGYVMHAQAGYFQTPLAILNFTPGAGLTTLRFDAKALGDGLSPAAYVEVAPAGGNSQGQWINLGEAGTFSLALDGQVLHTLTVSVNPAAYNNLTDVYLDNFVLTPEPGTLVLLGLGAAALRRRRAA